jgi:hypothetical protein
MNVYDGTHGRLLDDGNDERLTLVLRHETQGAEVRYTVRLRSFLEPSAGFPEPPSGDDAREYVAEVRVGERRRHGDVMGWSQDALIRDVLSALDQALTWPDVPSRNATTSSR